MRETAETMEQAKKNAVHFIEIPHQGDIKIWWASEPPLGQIQGR